jgi:3-methyladenine DNA glycosylase AlkD
MDICILEEEIRKELSLLANEQVRLSSQRFFKEPLKCYGIKAPDVRNVSRRIRKTVADAEKGEVFRLCEALFRSGYLEEAFIACNLVESRAASLERADIRQFQSWIHNYIHNWASCDTFCNHSVGSLVERFPENLSVLKEWTKSGNRWLRRASAVSLIIPARRGKFLDTIIEIAENLLTDGDDMVQKGYGWMLKAASQSHQQEVFDYICSRRRVMPRTALRYGIEKMPPEMKKAAMEKDFS